MSRLIAALVALLVLLPVANASANDHGAGGELRTLRAGHVGVVRGDDRRAVRPAGRHPRRRRHDQRADVDDEHRRLHVERGRPPSGSASSANVSCRAAVEDADDARAHGALRATPASSTTGTTTATGAKLTVWPPSGEPLTPILSSVDNGWLATGLKIVANSVPQLRKRAGALYDAMDFGFYYRPEANRMLFHYAPDTGDAPCCYDTVVSESRIVDYIGIARGQLPPKAYFGRWRTFPTPATSVAGDQAGRRRRAPTSASTSSRAPTSTTTRGSSRAGAATCSRP